jgi:predicted aspartyl protease
LWVSNESAVAYRAYFDLGEHTLTFNVVHARGRQRGAEVALPAAQLVRWRDGLIVYVKA